MSLQLRLRCASSSLSLLQRGILLLDFVPQSKQARVEVELALVSVV